MRNSLKSIVTTISLIPFFFLSACERTVSDTEKETVLTISEPTIDNMLAGLTANDYALFSRDFDTNLQEEIPEETFVTMVQTLDNERGSYLSRYIERVTRSDEFYVIIDYQAIFEMDESVKITAAFHASDFSIASFSFEADNFSWSMFQ